LNKSTNLTPRRVTTKGHYHSSERGGWFKKVKKGGGEGGGSKLHRGPLSKKIPCLLRQGVRGGKKKVPSTILGEKKKGGKNPEAG